MNKRKSATRDKFRKGRISLLGLGFFFGAWEQAEEAENET
jgi:hypothetical protein